MQTDSEKIDLIYSVLFPVKKTVSDSKEELKEFLKASIKRQSIKRLTKNK